MRTNSQKIDGPTCYQQAIRKARFGHHDWIVYRDATGTHAERKSPESVKRALLASGTKGNWSLICAGGTPMKGFWWLGINLLAQMKEGWY
jgi:hypothetical protein